MFKKAYAHVRFDFNFNAGLAVGHRFSMCNLCGLFKE